MGRRILVAVALVCVGCGPATESERPADGRLVSIQPSQVTTQIVGASPEQEKELLEILAGLGPTPLETVEVVVPEEGWSDAPDAVALKLSATKNDTLALWHGFLLGQAFQERSGELGLPPIAYLADFQSTSALGAAPQGPALTQEEAERLAKALRTAAARSGAEVRRIEILKPKRFAFAVELQAKDAAGFLLNDFDAALAPLSALRGRGYDGSYIKVVDGDGRTALETAGDASGGTGWVRPDLAGCKWIGLSHPIGWSPPPCPVKESKSVEVQLATISPAEVTTKIIGASPKQETVLRSILAGLGVSQIEAVEVLPAGKAWPSDDPEAVVIQPTLRDDSARAEWEGELLAEAFAERSSKLNLPRVSAIVTPDGGGGALDGGPENGINSERHKPVTAEALAALVAPAAKKSGAELLSAQLLEPDHVALAVVLRVDDPARFLRDRAGLFLSEVSIPDSDYGGLFIHVSDAQDRFVWTYSMTWSAFVETESSYPRADLRGCDPVPHSGPLGRTIPSCPIEASVESIPRGRPLP